MHKKIEIPVKVVDPKFSDYYKVNTFMGWDSESNVTKVLTDKIILSSDYYLNANGTAVTGGLDVKFNEFKPATGGDKIPAGDKLDYNNVIKEVNGVNVLGIKELGATATATVATVILNDGTNYPVAVKDEFKVKLAQQFDGAKVVYFNDGVKADKASVFQNAAGKNFIQAYYVSTQAANGTPAKYTGIAIEYNGKYIPVTTDAMTIDLYTIDQNETSLDAYTLNYGLSVATGSQGGNPVVYQKAVIFSDEIEQVGQGGKITFKFNDNVGLNYQTSIEYVKTNTVTEIK